MSDSSSVYVTSERLCAGEALAAAIRDAFGFDFVGVSLVPPGEQPELAWHCAAGNTNNRYRRIVLPENVGVLGITFSTRRPLVVGDVDTDIAREEHYQYPIVAAEGLAGFIAFPLFDGERVAMILICATREHDTFDTHVLGAVARFAAQHAGLRFEEREPVRPRKAAPEPVYSGITHKIFQAQEDERKRVARELHDGLLQEILLAQIELRKLKYLPTEQKDEGIERAEAKLREIMTHVGAIAGGLRPAALDELGLAAALTSHCLMLQDAFGVRIEVSAAELEHLEADCATALYRIFQEAAMNACKYSRAELIEVMLAQTNEAITLRIKDHGIGFNPASPALGGGGLGLVGMRERAELVGGTLDIASELGVGTVVTVVVPREAIAHQQEGVA